MPLVQPHNSQNIITVAEVLAATLNKCLQLHICLTLMDKFE